MKETIINQACSSRLSTILENADPDDPVGLCHAAVDQLRAEFGDDTVIRCLTFHAAIGEFYRREMQS